jgi:hypothetical protein
MREKLVITRRKKKPVVPILPAKDVKLEVEVTTQLVKPTRMPLRYPCIICSSFEHRAFHYPRKTKVHNMFWTKPDATPSSLINSTISLR